MGKRGRQGKVPTWASGSSQNNTTVTLREEKTGKKDPNSNHSKGVTLKFSERLNVKHLEWLSSWAAGEAKIASLAAFYGQRLAAVRESLGVPRNPSLFQCERCETVLKPGINCTIRPKKNKVWRIVDNETPRKPAPNYLVYACRFCSHGNLKRDKSKQRLVVTDSKKIETNSLEVEDNVNTRQVVARSEMLIESNSLMPVVLENIVEDEVNDTSVSTLEHTKKVILTESESPFADDLKTPIIDPGHKLLDGKKRTRKKPSSKKLVEPKTPSEVEKTSKSSKRKRKSWTSLKEIAHNIELDKKNNNIYDSPVPFSL